MGRRSLWPARRDAARGRGRAAARAAGDAALTARADARAAAASGAGNDGERDRGAHQGLAAIAVAQRFRGGAEVVGRELAAAIIRSAQVGLGLALRERIDRPGPAG